MPILFNCPSCGRELEAPDTAAGQAGSCHFCGAQLTAPNAPGEPAGLISPGAQTEPWQTGDRPTTTEPTGVLDPFGIASEAWSTYWRDAGLLFAATIAAGAIYYVVLTAMGLLSQLAGAVGGQVLGYVVGALLTPVVMGPFYVAARIVARREVGFGHVFQGFRHAGPLIQSALLLGVPMLVAGFFLPSPSAQQLNNPADTTAAMAYLSVFIPRMLLAVAVITIILLPLSLTTMEIIDRGCGVTEALRASVAATRGRLVMLFLTRLVVGLLAIAGVVVCGFGIIVTMPIGVVGEVLIYRHLRGLQGTPDG